MTEHPHQQKPPQPPAPQPCPDPCTDRPPYGPPDINPECCPKEDPCCDGKDSRPCTWDEVEDPCVRASSGECNTPWTKLTCECKSSNEKCKCDEWEWCGPGDSMCVPCKPCEGLVPEDTPDDDTCDDPPPDDCSSDALRKQLEANKKCISAQQAEKAKIEADIKAREERDKELAALIKDFDGIVEKYKNERYKLSCREDCLAGFYRDVARALSVEFPGECLEEMETAVNEQLCAAERAKCCQKNLEWKLDKDTRLIAEQKEAEKEWKAAVDAFNHLKDLAKWIGDRFTDLEKVKDQIAQALNDKDPLKHRYAFYLFYWKFVPGFCRRYRIAICCSPEEGQSERQSEQQSQRQSERRSDRYRGCEGQVGCEPGDWHPSKISPDELTKLICCAWEYVRSQKEKYQTASDAVAAATRNLDLIKKKVDEDGKTLDDRIRRQIEKVVCTPGPASRAW